MYIRVILGIIIGLYLVFVSVPIVSFSEIDLTTFNPRTVQSFSSSTEIILTYTTLSERNIDSLFDSHEKITQFMIFKENEFNNKQIVNNKLGDSLSAYSNIQLPVSLSFVNETSGELVIGLNINATGTYEEYIESIKSIVGFDIPIKLGSVYVIEESCNSVDDRCSPLNGGIEISTFTEIGTLTLPAFDNNGKFGFIVSGHVADDAHNGILYQPNALNPASIQIGNVLTNPIISRSSDSAFVEAFDYQQLEQKIFNPDGNPYNVIGTKNSTQTALFDIVSMAGIINKTIGGQNYTTTDGGVLAKNLTIDSPTYGILTNQIAAGYASEVGDSGAPIFSEDSGNNVFFHGLHLGKVCFNDFPPANPGCSSGYIFPVYSPWESIQSELNLADIDGTFEQSLCLPPLSGDWTINQNCTMTSSATAFENVIVNSPARLTIPNNVSLDIDFSNNHLMIKDGASVLVKNGGKID